MPSTGKKGFEAEEGFTNPAGAGVRSGNLFAVMGRGRGGHNPDDSSDHLQLGSGEEVKEGQRHSFFIPFGIYWTPTVCKVHCLVEASEMTGQVPGQQRWDKYANSLTPEKQTGAKGGGCKSSEDKGETTA